MQRKLVEGTKGDVTNLEMEKIVKDMDLKLEFIFTDLINGNGELLRFSGDEIKSILKVRYDLGENLNKINRNRNDVESRCFDGKNFLLLKNGMKQK